MSRNCQIDGLWDGSRPKCAGKEEKAAPKSTSPVLVAGIAGAFFLVALLVCYMLKEQRRSKRILAEVCDRAQGVL